jgi:hypothetical protein
MGETEDDWEHNAALEAIALVLEEVARQVRRLKRPVASRGASRPCKKGLQVGARVVVVCSQGKYLGRTGELVSRRGTMFWNVRLDASGADPARLVYKMDSSLTAT